MVKQESSKLKQFKNKILLNTTMKQNTNVNSPIIQSTPSNQRDNYGNDNTTLCILSLSSSKTSSRKSSTVDSTKIKKQKANDIELSALNHETEHENTLFNSTSSAISSTSSISTPPTNYLPLICDDHDDTGIGSVHREMAVDCPDNFIAEVKIKPCYPPRQTKTKNESNQNSIKKQNIINIPLKSLQIDNETSPIKYIDDNTSTKTQFTNKNSNRLIMRQKLNQEEENLRKIKTNDELLLRNSMRNSEKLKNLEENKQKTVSIQQQGEINNAFVNDESFNNSNKNENIQNNDNEDDDKNSNSDVNNDVNVDINDKENFNRVICANSSNDLKENDENVHIFDKLEENKKFYTTLDIDDLFLQIDYIQEKLKNTSNNEDITQIRDLYQTDEFQNALILYNKLIETTFNSNIKPICDNSYELAEEVFRFVENVESEVACPTMSYKQLDNNEANELRYLLSKLNIKNILQTHDQIAFNYDVKLQINTNSNEQIAYTNDENALLLSKAEHYCVENLKLVHIDKLDAPLGATIRNRDGSIVIGRIVKGGVAELSGLLHENDEILEVNEIPIRGKTINDVSDMLAAIQGTISFLIIPEIDNDYNSEKKKLIDIKHIRALFNYEPDEDLYIPCKELGLNFLKGDVLHIISQEDPDWWQAHKDGDKDQTLAGLIPSQSFQERRFSQMQALIGDSFMNRSKYRHNPLCHKGIKSKRRRMFESLIDPTLDDIVTYEEVVLYKPVSNKKRPIVLIGPHSIGRHELRKRLMQSNPSLYEVAVPHTTRSPRRDEIDGKDYHFIARHIFEADIKQGRFIEHGEFEKNLYGTSRVAIKKVIDNSKICVLNLYPQALKILRESDLMPYVIYIGPPSLSKLKELKINLNESYKENDLLDVIDKGREIEELYGHYFDKIIRNTDMDKTYFELVETIDKVQNEENWIPAAWLKSKNENIYS